MAVTSDKHFNPWTAELIVSIFHSFEAGIAKHNFQLQPSEKYYSRKKDISKIDLFD